MSAAAMQASVAVLINNRRALATYNYLIPTKLKTEVKVGQLVIVPVKTAKRLGFVVKLTPTEATSSLKYITAFVDSHIQLTQKQLQLAQWVADYYVEPLSTVLMLTLPPTGYTKVKTVYKLNPEKGCGFRLKQKDFAKNGFSKAYLVKQVGLSQFNYYLKNGTIKPVYQTVAPKVKAATQELVTLLQKIKLTAVKGQKQQAIVKLLLEEQPRPVKEVLSLTKATRASLQGLVKKGIIGLTVKPIIRKPDLTFPSQQTAIKLTAEQLKVINSLKSLIGHKYGVFLLEGVTGSGKTEVYIELVKQALTKAKTALVLVPEVALISQLAARLNESFAEQVCVYHSYLSAGERYDAWWQVFKEEKKVVVGTRSALFLPFQNLALIVIDEEHETSYKQNQSPRYHARSVAQRLAKLSNAVVVLGSATPAIESKFKAEIEGHSFKLTKRPLNQPLPAIILVDLRQAVRFKQSSLSEALKKALDECLAQNQKALIFLNRRGFAPYLICRDCGFVPHCRNCAVTLTYHSSSLQLKCHHCNAIYRVFDHCPKCQGLKIQAAGVGTERVEADLKTFYPNVPIVRFDADTVRKKNKHRELLLRFAQAKKGILVGTQMVSKGLDFPDIALVGVINADTALNLPDFRAAERTVQLMQQVAGRSGRGLTQGRVIVQTYNPDSYCLKLLNFSYDEFYRQELAWRQPLNYPPYADIINIVLSGPDKKATEQEANRLAEEVSQQLNADKSKILGPAPAPIEYLKAQYRWHFSVLTNESETVKKYLKGISNQKGKIKVIIDVDPVWLL